MRSPAAELANWLSSVRDNQRSETPGLVAERRDKP